MDRGELARFLRSRREALQPEDVGMPRTRRRRTGGLRREEVAALSDMSADYYSRIEQQRGPRPSQQVLRSIAQGLRLSLDERDHLLRLAGYAVPERMSFAEQINPGMLRIFERLEDTPAQILSQRGETLAQNRLSVLLLGDLTRYSGPARSLVFRWFTDFEERSRIPADDHATHGRLLTAQLLATHSRTPADPRTTALVDTLSKTSPEFAALWRERPVAGPYCAPKRIEHPRVGMLELHGQSLVDPDRSQILTAFTAEPGSESYDRLELLSARGERFG
ncbi:helix-turn-helix transcriptional regulator [Streptomyces sp. NPDC002911]